MSGFKDQERALATVQRINAATNRRSDDFVVSSALATSRPDQAVVNLERWLKATGSPDTLFDSLVAVPDLGRLLIALFGASHQIADVLVQNPELANLVLDPEALQSPPKPQGLKSEIEGLLAAASSYTHSLDRLRFLKQSWHVRIAAADLGRLWPERDVWRALSDVADACLVGASEVVWRHVGEAKGVSHACPVSIVAFGKLGGQELNFSSDIDLVYVLDDLAPSEIEEVAKKFCETLNRALANRMGRGSLYRVDLRLRPYGGRGPLVPRWAAVESYYAKYAESWEQLALLRSRVIVASGDIQEAWESLRDKTCFQPQRGEWFVQELLHMRARIEERHDESDIKRGAGGIRDVEFLTQILQVLYGHDHDALKVRPTCDALEELAKTDILSSGAVHELIASYTFLRQVEHRIQILGDQQSHSVPIDDEQRYELALRSGFVSLAAFDATLQLHRDNARNWYESVLVSSGTGTTARTEVVRLAGRNATLLSQWIDDLPSSEAFYESLIENESSIDRLRLIAERAPALVPFLRRSVSVTEQLMSGEVFEPREVDYRRLNSVPAFADAVRAEWLRSAVLWVLVEDFDFGTACAEAFDRALAVLAQENGLDASIIALGSYAGRELGAFSDLDVLFFSEKLDHEPAEKGAQAVLSAVQALRRAGAPIELDLRLRPEGRKGRLVQSPELVSHYDESVMEPWERLALGRARSVAGPVPTELRIAAFERPLDAETLESLSKMKRRVETERIPVQFRNRHIKLGPGGQDDALWMVGLLWWANAKEVDLEATSVLDRVSSLARVGAINAFERDALTDGWQFYARVRLQLAMLGLSDEVMPENPDKLERLANALGVKDGNEVLEAYERQRRVVRGLYESTMERLMS